MIFRSSLTSWLFLSMAMTLWSRAAAAAEARADQPSERVAVAKCISEEGTILRRSAPDQPWQVVKQGETLYSNDLMIGLPGAVLDSSNGAVRLHFIPSLGGAAPLPIVETAIVLHPSKEMDLDFTLDRGRVEFTNRKEKGEAKVRSRIRDRGPSITLEPGATCLLEIFGRWPAGMPFKKNAPADYAPMLHLIFLVLKGEITLHLQSHSVAMKAPPGPALIMWDSVHGGDPSPQRLDKLPEWAIIDTQSDFAKQRRAMLDEFRGLIVKKSIDAAIDTFLNSDDRIKRRVAVNAMGAMDDLERLGQALMNAKHPDVWDSGVLALRHWIGRGPGQDQKLYEGLVKMKGFTPVDAEAAMQLLHSFGEDELARPELYETLIDYLSHEKLAIRGLAHWHLVRLVPAGKEIGYNPLASKVERDKAIAQWQKLVPRGKLPPKW